MIVTYFLKSVELYNVNKGLQFPIKYKKVLLPIFLLALISTEKTREIAVTTLSDAFWAVSAYVAFTLALYHYLSLFINNENSIIRLYKKSRNYQVFFAALLGALPGCGGAIIVTTQFVSGRVGFAAIVAVLTSTMGDAAFLLLASMPRVGLSLILLGVIVGTISGLIVNTIHKDNFLRPKVANEKNGIGDKDTQTSFEKSAINLQGYFWKLLIIPATIIASLGSFQIDINKLLHLPNLSIEWIGTILIIISMILWALTEEIDNYQSALSEDKKSRGSHPLQKSAQDTNYITAWVIVAFLLFELTTKFANLDVTALFTSWGYWMPLLGLSVGLLPGCGPQILVTSLFISGAVPMSTLVANAISNDGDALFPVIALAPRAALVATFYSALPAAVIGYSYYFLFEF